MPAPQLTTSSSWFRSPVLLGLVLAACNGGGGGITIYNTPPSVTISTPPSGSSFDQYSVVTFTARVSDDQDPANELTVSWSSTIDGQLPAPQPADSDGNVTYSTANLSAGNHVITLLVIDSDAESEASTVQITINDVPENPEVHIVHPIAGESGLEDTPYEFVIEVSDSRDQAEDLQLSFESSIDGVFCNPTADGAGLARCTTELSANPAGTDPHLLTFTATDSDGDQGSATVYFTVLGRDAYDDDGDGWTENQGDCDDDDDDIHPGATETPDGVDEDCDGIVDEGTTAYDDDGDGFTEDEGDCNDADADVSPDAAEVTGNGIDDDCDGVVDDGTTDEDRDGYAPWAGDCDDTDDTVYPGAPELPDGIDNDCDDVVDEGTTGYDDDGDGWTEAAGDCDDTNAATSPDGEEIPGNGMDDDCDGDVDEDSELTDDDGDGFSEVAGDCDDTDEDVNPGATEIEGNGIDDDCDDETDEVASDDGDGDGFTTGDGDCDDTDGWAWPGATEFCDGVDNHCDGVVDEDCLEAEVTEEGHKDGGCGCGAVPGQQRGLAAVFGLLLGGLVLRRRR